MVAGFSRSFSLPGSPRPKPAPQTSHHVRSVSLPCRSHPIIAQLEAEIRSVKTWRSAQPEPESALSTSASSWMCDGIARLELLHSSLSDLINLPHNQDALRRGPGSEWTGRVLDDFLRFADAHGIFRSEMVAMKQHQSDAQVALRMKDTSKLESCIAATKKAERRLVKITSSLREVSKTAAAATAIFTNGAEEAELAGMIGEVISVTVSASSAVFLGIAAASSAALHVKNCWTAPLRRLSATGSFKRRIARDEVDDCGGSAMMERLEMAEECLMAAERRCERLFRCLINTRVSLLNILTC